MYLLKEMGGLGCFPECVAVDTDDKGVFSAHYVKVTAQNLTNYLHLFDETDHLLFESCRRLEQDVILTKIKDRHIKSWADLSKKYFGNKKLSPDLRYIKDYLVDYIETNQNCFLSGSGEISFYVEKSEGRGRNG